MSTLNDPAASRAERIKAIKALAEARDPRAIDTLIKQLRTTMARTPKDLDLSYRSLDAVSEFVETLGIERAQQELYDQLVAYVGEVLRSRLQGRWELNRNDPQPYPYIVAAEHNPIMPISVVWSSALRNRGLRYVTMAALPRRSIEAPGNSR